MRGAAVIIIAPSPTAIAAFLAMVSMLHLLVIRPQSECLVNAMSCMNMKQPRVHAGLRLKWRGMRWIAFAVGNMLSLSRCSGKGAAHEE
jgi:hypothetical protein